MAHSLIATLGPASWHLVPALPGGGATALRLNASHMDVPALRAALRAARRDAPGTEIVVDLQGAKMRLGDLAPRDLARGERVVFALDPAAGIPLPHPEFFAQADTGDTLSVDDGRLRFGVVSRGAGRLDASVLDAGRLLPRKGVNLVEHPVLLGGLTAADRDAVLAAVEAGVRTFAFSFMTDGREARWVRALAPGCRVVGKVERREATTDLAGLAREVDAVWICRGDLGAQLGAARLARFVASVTPASLPVPVLMAGQVLEHLTRHRDPTRSEICHLHDLLARGYAGIVLSDETAIGDDPLHAVATASGLLASLAA